MTEPARPQPLPASAADLAERVVANLGLAVHAPVATLRLPLLCLLSEGHALVEDVPGVGKTVLAKALARSLDLAPGGPARPLRPAHGARLPAPRGGGPDARRADDGSSARASPAGRAP